MCIVEGQLVPSEKLDHGPDLFLVLLLLLFVGLLLSLDFFDELFLLFLLLLGAHKL